MNVLVLAVTMAMAGVLLWAGLEKARGLSSLAAVLRELGVPRDAAGMTAALVVALELSVALGLIFRPHSPATPAGVIGLAAAFALSGLVALRMDKDIHCGCLGAYAGGRLGISQLAAFPLWLGGATLVWRNAAAGTEMGAALSFAAVALTVATLRGFEVARAAREARGDRRSAREMYTWLSR